MTPPPPERPTEPDDDETPYPDDFDFDDEDFDCARDDAGNCGKAGSEECDFECPYRDRPEPSGVGGRLTHG